MPADQNPAPTAPRTVLLNASFGPSLINFRGPLIEAMAAAGHKVHVTAPDIDAGLAARLRAIGATPHQVRLARSGLNPVADFRYMRRIRRLIGEIGADLVVSYTIKPNIWASLAARGAGVPSVSMITGLGYAFIEGGGLKRKLVRAASRLLYRLATAANQRVIFQNPDDRAEFVSGGCLRDEGKARMVNGSGVDMDRFAPAPLPDDAVFLMITRFLINKGVREYGAAASAILARRKDARFLLVGYAEEGPDGVGRAELDRWKSSGVEILGPLDDVRPAIASASVYVLPSYREGTPRTVLEAMAMGRPVVTTDVPGCRETVVDGDNGFLVPPRDPEALAAAMERLIEEPGLRAAMGARGLALCRTKYDVNEVNAALLRHLSLAREG